jgi:uncharacterized membrane protein
MKSVPVVVTSIWLGAMGFFAFLVAPAVFATLDRDATGRLVSAIFPRYYLVGTILGLVALAACIARSLPSGWRTWDVVTAALVLVMLALTLYAWMVVLPAAHAAREALREAGAGASPAEAVRFARLHRLSAVLNGTVMLAGALLLAVEVMRRP